MKKVDWISEDDWNTIVSQVPIVSIDLVVLCDDGVLLGKRENEPAKGEWFVPGGRVQKGETLVEAVDRVSQQELGTEVEIIESLGSYEHFYEATDVEGSGGKHYLANGFVVRPESVTFSPDNQHSDLQIFYSDPGDLHEYTLQYLQDADRLSEF
jgi:colanic acid biosynthesis protein WcaH